MINKILLPIILSIIATIITNAFSELFKEYKQYKKDSHLAEKVEQIINACGDKKKQRAEVIDEHILCKFKINLFEMVKHRMYAREFYLDAPYFNSFISIIKSHDFQNYDVKEIVNKLLPRLRKLKSKRNIGPIFDLYLSCNNFLNRRL